MIVFSEPLSDHPTHEQLDDRLRGLMLEKAAMEKLTKTPGWDAFCRMVNMNADTFQKALEMNPFDSMGAVFTDQFAKGIANGLRRSLELVQASATAYDGEIKIVVLKMEELNGSSTEHPDSSSNGSDAREREPDLFPDSDTFVSAP